MWVWHRNKAFAEACPNQTYRWDDQLNKRKINEPLLEIETQGNVNPGYSSLPPVEGNKSVPEGWKIRSDKNKLEEHQINISNPTLVAKFETEREFRDIG